ncbi:hypothetical protein Tco_0460923 [Tanacetum coccineum]
MSALLLHLIHKNHPQSQIIGKSTAGVLTRRKLKESVSDQHQALLSFMCKQNRTNHKDQQTCLFACFLSQEEPKKVLSSFKQIKLGWKRWQRRTASIQATKMSRPIDFRTIKPASTPIEAHKSLGKDEEGEDVDVHLYRFQVTPKVSHMHAVKRIFRYLKHQQNGLWYPKDSPFHLEAFSDSDYARDNHDRRSTSGGCQYLGGRLVSWQCKKQTIVAISSTEAEYVAAASCCAQTMRVPYAL